MIFTAGDNAVPDQTVYDVVDAQKIDVGVSIAYYHVPPFVFNVLSAQTIDGLIHGWLSLKNQTQAQTGGVTVDILGVYIDTDIGDIYIKFDTTPLVFGSNVQQAGINPMMALYVIIGLFAAISITITLVAVYAPHVAQQAIKPIAQGLSTAEIVIGLGIAAAVILVAVNETGGHFPKLS